MKKTNKLTELAKLFLKLGCISFGGPAAHIAMMENEVVKKRKWMTHEHFLDLVGATNLIPGPNSTEMTMHCGHEQAGIKGLIVAGLSFILPAVTITSVLAFLYEQYGHLPDLQVYIYGIKPAVIAIIISALISLGKKGLKNKTLILLAVTTTIACLAGINEIIALFASGMLGIVIHLIQKSRTNFYSIFPLFILHASQPEITGSTLKIFGIFLKIGALLYGGGYVLFAFLDAELVNTGLLSRQVLIDSVAVGQFTPGPVLSTATFIGWQMQGIWGAIAATAGIFLPSFLLVLFLNPLIPRLRKSNVMAAFLNAVNAGSIAIIAAVCIQMGKATVTDWKTSLIMITSLFIAFRFNKLNSAFIVIGGAVSGLLLSGT